MRTKRNVVALLIVLCSACESVSDTDNAENANDGMNDHDSGDRGTVSLDNLVDAAGGHDGEGGAPLPPADGGEPPITDGDAETPLVMDGSTPPLPDAAVMPDVPPVVPADPGTRGPWPVGVRTARLAIAGGMSAAEVWYPAVLGSDAGQPKVIYDFIMALPPEAQEEVPAVDKPVPVTCNCYRDLPVATTHGPFPVVLFVHNFGAFRTASSGLMEQWASRGFVVIALDHPRLHLQDVLAYASLGACTGSGLTDDANRTRDISALLAVVRAPSESEQFAFLAGVVDATHIAVAGHSDGAGYAANASGEAGVRLIMLWNNPIEVTKQGDLEAIAYFAVSGDRTTATGYNSIRSAYLDAATPAVFFGADRTGHLSMTELCNAKSSQGRDGMDIASRYGLCGIDYTILRAGWDCSSTYLNQQTANAVFGLATTATLEQYLKGKDHTAAWTKLNADHGEATVRQ